MDTAAIQRLAAMLPPERRGSMHVAVMTGAGVSAESGIATFRGAGGLWRGNDPAQLATPEAFARDPELVWAFYNERRAKVHAAEPNSAHHSLAELADLVGRLTLITQNVDRLHHRAGSRDVLELHGNLMEVRCSGCGRTEDRSGETLPDLPRCAACDALVRPAVVWFGERLPEYTLLDAYRAAQEADLFLVVGTSSLVYPAAGLTDIAANAGTPTVEINLDPTPVSARVTLSIQGRAGEVLPVVVAALKESAG